MKRAFDAAAAGIGLLVLSPLLVGLAFAVRLSSPGPVFFRGARVGRGGRDFRIFKFRSMRVEPALAHVTSTAGDDPRITAVGHFLRRTKLDEVPQLLNVLRGEMSLVGPRPQVRWAVELYTPEERRLLSVRPGMTDFASIRFRNEEEILRGAEDPDRAYLELIAPEKIRLGLFYVERHTLGMDLRILAMTLGLALGWEPDPEAFGGLLTEARGGIKAARPAAAHGGGD